MDVGTIQQASRLDFLEFEVAESISNYGLTIDRRLPEIESISVFNNGNRIVYPCRHAHGGNIAYSKQRAIEIGGHDERFDGCWGYEDLEFAHRYGEDYIFYVNTWCSRLSSGTN